jgi:hypothetical protein
MTRRNCILAAALVALTLLSGCSDSSVPEPPKPMLDKNGKPKVLPPKVPKAAR